MRITNQVLNESARKAGLPIQGTSLLDYVNKNPGSDQSLLQALEERESASTEPVNKKNYEKLEKALDAYEKEAEKFADKSETSMFEKAKESKDMTEICDNVDKLVAKYNSAVSAMRKSDNPLDAYYLQMFLGTTEDQKKELAEIGITMGKDGSLSVDREKLKTSDLSAVERALGADSTFITRTGFVAGRAADHAHANVRSVSTQYNAAGNTYAAQSSLYDFLR